jgi:regulator of sigma E protease
MNPILWNTLAFIVTLSVLVAVHEFGHFWVARRMGVHVLTFSIGFGPALFKWRDKSGCEYVFAAIPLGGYVKMLDEREGDVPPDLLHRAFNQASVKARWAIVAAGPFFNFAFAIIAFALMFMVGVTDMRAVLGPIPSGTPAAALQLREGDEIIAVADKPLLGWDAVGTALVGHIGSTDALRITIKNAQGQHDVWLPADRLVLGEKPELFLTELGFTPTRIPAVIGEVVKDGPADRIGLKRGDKLLALNDQTIDGWADFREKIAAYPNRTVTLDWLRGGQKMSAAITPDRREESSGKAVGIIGVGFDRDALLVRVQHDPLSAIYHGVTETFKTIKNIAHGIVQLISGHVPLKAISGPLSIAESAGATASIGFDWFMKFLGLLSVNLGLINLLPIPMLDGGHLLFYSVEALRGKPLSERIQEIGMRIGLSMVATLMMLALYNDFTRYF